MEENNAKEVNSTKKGSLIGLIIALVFLVISLGVNGYLIYSKYFEQSSPEEKTETETKTATAASIKYILTDAQKKAINDYIASKDLNEFGEAKDAIYAGGTPLFDEATGTTTDKYDYAIDHNADIKKLVASFPEVATTPEPAPVPTTESLKNTLFDYRITYPKSMNFVGVGQTVIATADSAPESEVAGKIFAVSSEMFDGNLTKAITDSTPADTTAVTSIKNTTLGGKAAKMREYDQEGMDGKEHYTMVVALYTVKGNQRKLVIISNMTAANFTTLKDGFTFEE